MYGSSRLNRKNYINPFVLFKPRLVRYGSTSLVRTNRLNIACPTSGPFASLAVESV